MVKRFKRFLLVLKNSVEFSVETLHNGSVEDIKDGNKSSVKVNKHMYKYDDIMQFVNIVVEITDPDRIILFGSYAYGNPDDKSDVDLLVIKNGKELTNDEHAGLSTSVFRRRKQHKIGTKYDIFFRTDDQVKESAINGGAFYDALQRGRIVYERELT